MTQDAQNRQWDSRHFALVVKDLQKTVEYYSSLGLGAISTRESSIVANQGGMPISFSLKLGFSAGGNTQTEIIEPGENASFFAQALATRGEGGHHIGFYVDDLDDVIEAMAKAGVKPLFKGTAPDQSIRFATMDTASIGGVVIQLHRGPAPLEEAPKVELGLSQLKYVGVVVEDIDRTVEFYNAMGFGPFRVREAVADNLVYCGKPASMKLKLAVPANWRLPIEFIQPIEGGELYRETLETKGEGIEHVVCSVPDMPSEIARLESMGIRTLLRGGGHFCCMDTREIGGLIIELVQQRQTRREG